MSRTYLNQFAAVSPFVLQGPLHVPNDLMGRSLGRVISKIPIADLRRQLGFPADCTPESIELAFSSILEHSASAQWLSFVESLLHPPEAGAELEWFRSLSIARRKTWITWYCDHAGVGVPADGLPPPLNPMVAPAPLPAPAQAPPMALALGDPPQPMAAPALPPPAGDIPALPAAPAQVALVRPPALAAPAGQADGFYHAPVLPDVALAAVAAAAGRVADLGAAVGGVPPPPVVAGVGGLPPPPVGAGAAGVDAVTLGVASSEPTDLELRVRTALMTAYSSDNNPRLYQAVVSSLVMPGESAGALAAEIGMAASSRAFPPVSQLDVHTVLSLWVSAQGPGAGYVSAAASAATAGTVSKGTWRVIESDFRAKHRLLFVCLHSSPSASSSLLRSLQLGHFGVASFALHPLSQEAWRDPSDLSPWGLPSSVWSFQRSTAALRAITWKADTSTFDHDALAAFLAAVDELAVDVTQRMIEEDAREAVPVALAKLENLVSIHMRKVSNHVWLARQPRWSIDAASVSGVIRGQLWDLIDRAIADGRSLTSLPCLPPSNIEIPPPTWESATLKRGRAKVPKAAVVPPREGNVAPVQLLCWTHVKSLVGMGPPCSRKPCVKDQARHISRSDPRFDETLRSALAKRPKNE
jgi:hypothetical protein